MANGRYITCFHIATSLRDFRPCFLWSFGNYRFYASHPGWRRIPLAKTPVLNSASQWTDEETEDAIYTRSACAAPCDLARLIIEARDGDRLFHDLCLITLASKDRGVVAAQQLIAQLRLPLSRVENEAAFRARDGAPYRIVVQSHVEHILQIAANGVASLEYAARRHSDSVLGEGCRHSIRA
jgi:hypothetical protein